MQITDNSTPAVILRSARHGGLGIVRSLGRLGVPVYVVDPDPWTPAVRSRYCVESFERDIESDAPAASIHFLRELHRKLGRRALLIPTTDAATMFVDEHAEMLCEGYLFPERPEGLARSLCSKKEMYGLAKRHNIPTAETVFPQCRRDVLDSLETARFPIMLKGIYGKKLKLRTGKPMFIVRNAADLLERYDAIEDPAEPNLMLQEYIPGGDDTIWMFNGYFNAASDCLVGFTGRKLRQCPVYTGPTCLGVVLPNEQVDRSTRDFMRATGYCGALDIDYRYDARDGLYKVLDVNPRIGATFRLFVGDNGLDVARALYLDITGQPVPSTALPDGRKWIVEDCDIVSTFRYKFDDKLTFREWRRSLHGIREGALWAKDDLFPMLAMLTADARDSMTRVFGRSSSREPAPAARWAKQ